MVKKVTMPATTETNRYNQLRVDAALYCVPLILETLFKTPERRRILDVYAEAGEIGSVIRGWQPQHWIAGHNLRTVAANPIYNQWTQYDIRENVRHDSCDLVISFAPPNAEYHALLHQCLKCCTEDGSVVLIGPEQPLQFYYDYEDSIGLPVVQTIVIDEDEFTKRYGRFVAYRWQRNIRKETLSERLSRFKATPISISTYAESPGIWQKPDRDPQGGQGDTDEGTEG